MLRDPSLIPLSHQHQHALALCVLIDRALAATTSGHAAVQARTIVEQFDSEMQKHFEVEEQILFPVLMPFASVQDVVTGLIDEHRRIAAIVDELRERADKSLIAGFAALLREHVRKEEGLLFEETQRLLPREKLDHIGEQIAGIL